MLACAALPLGASGCAPSIASWIVKERNQQGDVALRRGNYPDASVAYQLALKLDPVNVHARTGLTERADPLGADAVRRVALRRGCRRACGRGALHAGRRPRRDAAQRDRAGADQARHRRVELPAVQGHRASLRRSYTLLKTQNQTILAALKRFDYTYDTADLSAAIRQSYALNEEIARLTNRLQQYRQLVESGVPEHGADNLAPPASLLPLP